MDPYLVRYTGRLAVKLRPGAAGVAGLLENVASVHGLRPLAPATGGDGLERWRLVDARGWSGHGGAFHGLASPAAADIDDRAERLRQLPAVEEVEPEADFRAVGDWADAWAPRPRPTLPPDWDWHLRAIGVIGPGAPAETGAGVKLGLLDTGVHEPVVARLLGDDRIERGWDFDEDDGDLAEGADFPRFPAWHGTGTLGLLAGRAADGYRGVATEARVRVSRVGPSVVLVRNTALASAIDDAARNGVNVLSISMGGAASPLWSDAVDAAYAAGVVVCAAVGNHFGWMPIRCVVYPARFARVVAVAGVTRGDTPYATHGHPVTGMRGNYGVQVDVCAPTPDVIWAQPDDAGATVYEPHGGTSSATPQVAGVAALWFQRWAQILATPPFAGANRWRRVEACRRALQGSARPLPGQAGVDRYFGHGRIDAIGALHETWRPTTAQVVTKPDVVPVPWWRTLNPCAAS